MTPRSSFLLHVLGNSAIHALGLCLLYRDCRANGVLTSMNVFCIPLGAAALYLSASLLYFAWRGHDVAKSASRMALGWGIGVSLFIALTGWIEGSI